MAEDKIKEIEFVLWLTGSWYCQLYYCAFSQGRKKKQKDNALKISSYLDFQYVLVGNVLFLQHFTMN